ncbi:MAG: indolepyruvate oxidoreductase subunit beta [Candidatus Methanomethylicus sp.]|nr:indolepyruvate oxidoreductase subunit beta [Candidatus Methanomethylicus sp.]
MKAEFEELGIIISGVGGQGNVRSAQILGSAAVNSGYRARVSDVFGIAQRGGPVVSHLRIGREIYGSMIQEHKADVVVSLEPMEALRAVTRFLKPNGMVILSTRPIYPVEVNTGKMPYPTMEVILKLIGRAAGSIITLDATQVAEEAGIPIAANIVMLGVLSGIGILPISNSAIKDSIRENIPRSIEQNLRAFDAGYAIGGHKRGN